MKKRSTSPKSDERKANSQSERCNDDDNNHHTSPSVQQQQNVDVFKKPSLLGQKQKTPEISTATKRTSTVFGMCVIILLTSFQHTFLIFFFLLSFR